MRRRIAIVGGGPAGSTMALELLRLGVDPGDMTILDRAHFPRPKLCGGAITWRGTRALTRLGLVPDHKLITNGLEFRSSLGSIPVRERGEQWIYDRASLDHQLLRKVAAAGVEVREGVTVRGLVPGVGSLGVETSSGVERFDWVIGADGARSGIRRAAELRGGIVGRLVEAVYEGGDESVDPNTLVFDFDPVLEAIPGYAWIFPYPKPGTSGLFKLGIMDGRGRVPGEILRRYTADLAERHGFRLADEKISGWPEHYFGPRVQASREGLLLIGEAWGIDPLLGEGIAPSFAISEYAAGRLKRALDRGSRKVRGYELGFFATREGQNLLYQHRLANMLYDEAPHRWMRVLFSSPALLQAATSGDEAYGRLAHLGPRLGVDLLRSALKQRRLPSAKPPRAPNPRYAFA